VAALRYFCPGALPVSGSVIRPSSSANLGSVLRPASSTNLGSSRPASSTNLGGLRPSTGPGTNLRPGQNGDHRNGH